MTEFSIIYCTVPDAETAEKITTALISERLVPCVNQVQGIVSVYRWKGNICRENEILLMMKTKSSLFEKIEKTIRAIHPYEVPEIISEHIDQVSCTYAEWIKENTL